MLRGTYTRAWDSACTSLMDSGIGWAWISKVTTEINISVASTLAATEIGVSPSRSAEQKLSSQASRNAIYRDTETSGFELEGRKNRQQTGEPGAEIKRSPQRHKRAWPAGEGGKLPSWLHIIIRKREQREASSTSDKTSAPPLFWKKKSQGAGRPLPPTPSELTSHIMKSRKMSDLLQIAERHAPDGIFHNRPLSAIHLTALFQQAAWLHRGTQPQLSSVPDTDWNNTLCALIEKLNIRLFQLMDAMDSKGLSQVLWSMGKLGQRIDPVLTAAVLEHLGNKVNSLASHNSSGVSLDGGRRKGFSPSSLSVPRVHTASMEELMGMTVGLTWLGVRFDARWQILLSAISRQANSGALQPKQIPLLLKCLVKGDAGWDDHLVDAIAARLLDCLPELATTSSPRHQVTPKPAVSNRVPSSRRLTGLRHVVGRSSKDIFNSVQILATCADCLHTLGLRSSRLASAFCTAGRELLLEFHEACSAECNLQHRQKGLVGQYNPPESSEEGSSQLSRGIASSACLTPDRLKEEDSNLAVSLRKKLPFSMAADKLLGPSAIIEPSDTSEGFMTRSFKPAEAVSLGGEHSKHSYVHWSRDYLSCSSRNKLVALPVDDMGETYDSTCQEQCSSSAIKISEEAELSHVISADKAAFHKELSKLGHVLLIWGVDQNDLKLFETHEYSVLK
ncbi:hypothetical protein CEUSTIGMA_g5664.t1 [Chlamydomonas eustigma]|uniref:Uncharacterized protein n=1 Tax=Chlamydomonas eustigma TaxID=1157962 RepID=A0A250X5Q3_9CHLO|nr:hypothetical protein CEUSTIGMA_g5664.t1 [Chlamydomonas eustigma]|eukprot:GAX78222.1 hypothetical protein CEUSTIGMA_g5664.t1 [Chlamydomonas eustigma]